MADQKITTKEFENRQIRTAWNAEQEEWFFSVSDIITILTNSIDPRQYIKKMRTRDPELNSKWGTICTLVAMPAADGKMRKIQAAKMDGILRIIQSIPSKKAEPLKIWLAKVGSERIEETIDPEKAIDRAFATYLKKGYNEDWINQRLLTIRVRKELTDEWQKRGVQKGKEYAILTDEITKAWAGMSTRQYKSLKGLKKENLRDNMSTTELVLNMLAETSTKDISAAVHPAGFTESRKIARKGGEVAGIARKALEEQTGVPVITSMKSTDFHNLLTSIIEAAPTLIREEDGDDTDNNK